MVNGRERSGRFQTGRGGLQERALYALTGPTARLVLVLGLAFALFVGTDQHGRTFSADTARYALVGREIVERGDPSRLTLDGKPYAKKPPLVFWLEAGAYSMFGFTEGAARLPSRAFGLASLALLMALAARHHGLRAAFWTGLCMTTWHAFQRSACTARLDTALTFFTIASLAVFLAMDRRGFTPWRALGLGSLIGFGVLAKGPPGLLGAGAILLGAVLTGRSRLAFKTIPLAATAAAAVAAPWYILQAVREGQGWTLDLVADWTRSQEEAGLGKFVALYAKEFFLPAAPWLVPSAAGVAWALRRVRGHPRRALPEALFLSLAVVLLAGLACRAAHHARYVIPLVPVLAFTAGPWIAHRLRRRRPERAVATLLAIIVLAAYPLGIAVGVPRMRVKYEDVRHAAELVRDEYPQATILPTWPPHIGAGIREATRFYFGLSLRPFDPSDTTQPSIVLLRSHERRPEFESLYGLRALVVGEEGIIYDRRKS